MTTFYANTVSSVTQPALLVVLSPADQGGWCKQLSEEGYDVAHVAYPGKGANPLDTFQATVIASNTYGQANRSRGLITYGIDKDTATAMKDYFPQSKTPRTPAACIHFCPAVDETQLLVYRRQDGTIIPTVIHLASSQEGLHAALLSIILEPGYEIPTEEPHPLVVHTYPRVSATPPFPFLAVPPALQSRDGKPSEMAVDPNLRSAVSLSYTRTLQLLKRTLGPHYDLEKLWEKHTYYEFEERDALKTMSTMVSTPYVNHIPTMTGGLGYEELARFYKYHFTRENVTPPDTELITISRTVGADRIIDEMIFKCTHTTEIDYFLPGIKPTGKPLELALVGVVAFRGDKLTFEHIYWDQASALVQLGLLAPGELPIAGVEVARKVVNPFGLPSNTLMEKWKESSGLPL